MREHTLGTSGLFAGMIFWVLPAILFNPPSTFYAIGAAVLYGLVSGQIADRSYNHYLRIKKLDTFHKRFTAQLFAITVIIIIAYIFAVMFGEI